MRRLRDDLALPLGLCGPVLWPDRSLSSAKADREAGLRVGRSAPPFFSAGSMGDLSCIFSSRVLKESVREQRARGGVDRGEAVDLGRERIFCPICERGMGVWCAGGFTERSGDGGLAGFSLARRESKAADMSGTLAVLSDADDADRSAIRSDRKVSHRCP